MAQLFSLGIMDAHLIMSRWRTYYYRWSRFVGACFVIGGGVGLYCSLRDRNVDVVGLILSIYIIVLGIYKICTKRYRPDHRDADQ